MRLLKSAFILGFLAFNVLTINAQIQSCNWVKGGGSAGLEIPGGIYLDAQGNTYVTYTFSDTLETFGQTFISAGMTDVLVCKINPGGDLIWAEQFGWKYGEFAKDIVVDEVHQLVYIAGEFHDSTILGTKNVYPYYINPDFNYFIIKTDTAGNFQWSKESDGASDERSQALALDSEGNIWVAGKFENFFMADWDTMFSNGLEDGFIVMYDSAFWHRKQWSLGGADNDAILDLAIIDDTLIAVTGYYMDTLYFADSTVILYPPTPDNKDVFVVLYDTAGNFKWATSLYGPGNDVGNSIVAAPGGEIWVGGKFDSMLTRGTLTVPSNGAGDGFIYHCNTQNTLLNLSVVGGTGYDLIRSINRTNNGAIVITGSFQDKMFIGSTLLDSGDPSNSDAFIAQKATGSGTVWDWAWQGGGVGYDEGAAIAIDPNGIISVSGIFGDISEFSFYSLVSAGGDDHFTMQLNSMVHRDEDFHAETGITLYPNPANQFVNLRPDFPVNAESSLEIFDLQGKIWYQGSWVPGSSEIRMNLEMPNGLYFVKMTGFPVQRLIVAH